MLGYVMIEKQKSAAAALDFFSQVSHCDETHSLSGPSREG